MESDMYKLKGSMSWPHLAVEAVGLSKALLLEQDVCHGDLACNGRPGGGCGLYGCLELILCLLHIALHDHCGVSACALYCTLAIGHSACAQKSGEAAGLSRSPRPCLNSTCATPKLTR